MADGCASAEGVVCGGIPLGPGCRAHAALTEKSESDPWWATASIVAHSGQITYDPQQRIVDTRWAPASERGTAHRRVTSVHDAVALAYGTGGRFGRLDYPAQLWRTRAAMLVVASRRFAEATDDGRSTKHLFHGDQRTRFVDAVIDDIKYNVRDVLAEIDEGRSIPENAAIAIERGRERAERRKEKDKRQLDLFRLLLPGTEVVKRYRSGNVAQQQLLGLDDELLDEEGVVTLAGLGAAPGKGRPGISRKSRALFLEYLGDPEAVAADRHVAYYACRLLKTVRRTRKPYTHYLRLSQAERRIVRAGLRQIARTTEEWLSVNDDLDRAAKRIKTTNPLRFERGDEITYGEGGLFDRVVEAVRAQAASCGVAPAQLQVGAWAWGVCTSAQRGASSIYLFAGAPPFDCREHFYGQEPGFLV